METAVITAIFSVAEDQHRNLIGHLQIDCSLASKILLKVSIYNEIKRFILEEHMDKPPIMVQ